ncbi:hypothetical protein Pmani_019641 [Petrolisthes manimaculis]|uniref:Uncharacterized protein n=1 Tax=Petrolisthes manimaculis TaxID=1843537 RepID=A0AAE1U771_9EUCA|nr:hypothetical protein Pmani_019641 [Petrolisthes manimaculis]
MGEDSEGDGEDGEGEGEVMVVMVMVVVVMDYWAEVSALRRDLLFCQLGSTSLPPIPSLSLDILHTPSTSTPPSLPLSPLQLVASPTLHAPPALGDPLGSALGGLQERGDTTNSGGTRPPRSLASVMMADQTTTIKDTSTQDQEYLNLLERQVRELMARVSACRSCLARPQKKLAMCGGGKAWREHRRRRKLLRRQERLRRRQNRRNKKKQNKTSRRRLTTTTAAAAITSSTTPTTSSTSPTTSSSTISSTTTNPTISATTTPTTSPPSTSPTISTTTTTSSNTRDKNPPSYDTLLADVAYSDQRTEQDHHRARETHRMSTDFRRGFNQKISRMDEALMQFTDTQAAFCKELRDNLGARLEKRGQELEALSSQIAALVRTATAQITALEKVASDQMYAGQASIEKTLAMTQAIRDSQLRAIQNYHKQTFLPLAATVATLLTDQASALTAMGVQLITKVEMLQDVYLTYATRQADTMKKMAQEVDMFSAKHSNLVTRSGDHANRLHLTAENFVRELQTRVNNVVKELVMIRVQSQSFVSSNNDTHADIAYSLNQTRGAVEGLSQGLRGQLDNATHLERDFRKVFKRETDQISARVESGVSQALVSNHGSVSQMEEGELDTRVFVGSATAAWNELYLNQEAELRKEADHLTHSLRAHTHHTQNVLGGMRSVAETHEQVLEEQRGDFQRFIRKRQEALDNQCSSISDWAVLMSTELRRRDLDLHRFLSEDLQFASVTVAEEDDDGYLVSRLPDGTLLYQSTPAQQHTRSLPNVRLGLTLTPLSR